MDNLVECKRCGGNACYEQVITPDEQKETVTTWLCMGCGFTTSTVMKEDSPATKNTLEVSPELYRDLMFIDKEKHAWFPATITLPEKGMVFLDGTDKSNWRWAASVAVPLTEEEIKSGRFPKGQTFKMGMSDMRHFDQKGFMDALEVIGFFQPIEEIK